MKILKKIFEVKNINKTHKQITFMGFRFKLKRQQNEMSLILEKMMNTQTIFLRDMNRTVQTLVSTAMLHQKTFLPFKNCYQGKEIVIVASGPTAKYYNAPINGAIHIGVNRAFQLESVDFNHIFIQDYSGPTKTYIEDLIAYKPETCQKFFGLTTEYENSWERVIPESLAIRAKALRYRTDWVKIPRFQPKFAYDISTQPLGCFGSIVFPALQFALWTNPKTIYLVGCDCTSNGYFNTDTKSPEFNPDKVYNIYLKFRDFAKVYYPEVKIVSINPVGLRKVFDEDIYTELYMNKDVAKV